MIPADFDYVRAQSVAQAVGLLAADEEARPLAGGHSLIPLMRLRLATPGTLVDIGGLGGLRQVRDEGEHLAIGALVTHRMLETDPVVRRRAGLLAEVAAGIGDPQVRHRGTIGGSVAHGDPASDLPAALLALDARYVLTGPAGSRAVPAARFHLGFLATALAQGEILTQITVPAGVERFGYAKFRGRAADWAVAGVAVAAHGGGPAAVRVALVNMAATVVRAHAVEDALASGEPAARAAGLAAEGTDPPSDLAASAGFRRHLARVLTARTLERVMGGTP